MHFTSTLTLVLATLASTAFASPQIGSYPGSTADGVLWKRYEGKRFSTGPPPPPHPAELAPRSIHRSKPSRYHTTAAAGTRTGGTDEDAGKRKLMNYKQVTAQDVKKRALDRKDVSGSGGKKVYFEVKRSKEEEEEEAEGDEEEIEVIEGWSWVDDDEEAIQIKNDKSLSWSQKMEVRMRKTRPLFANSN